MITVHYCGSPHACKAPVVRASYPRSYVDTLAAAYGLDFNCQRQRISPTIRICCATTTSNSSDSGHGDVKPFRHQGSPGPQLTHMNSPASPGEGDGGRPSLVRWLRVLARAVRIAMLRLQSRAVHLCSRLLSKTRSLLAKTRPRITLGLIVLLLASLSCGAFGPLRKPPQEVITAVRKQLQGFQVMYSDFLLSAQAGLVQSAMIDDGTSQIYFRVNVPEKKSVDSTSVPAAENPAVPTVLTAAAQPADSKPEPNLYPLFFTKRVADTSLVPMLLAKGVRFGAVRATLSGAASRMLGTVIALWLPLVPIFLIMRHTLGSRSNIRNKKGSNDKSAAQVTTFRDIAGVDVACQELLEVVACLRDSDRYAALNAKVPSGVLLCGPPGTGKTLLARAVAGEAGVPFFAAAASEFVELFVGRGAARIRDLFAEARKKSPAVVFIDELDAIGGKRGIGLNEERDQTLNQLLTELDGFEGRQGVLLLAATNRPEVLDAALTRPGRLSRRVLVPLPDEQGRANILQVHLRDKPMVSAKAKQQACYDIAKCTRGFSGAELANVANEAALLAGRKGAVVVTLADLLEAVERTRFGVNGGAENALGQSVRRRLRSWLVDSLSSDKQMRTLPVPGG